MEPSTVVLAADETYAAPLAVAMRSIILTCSSPTTLRLIVIDEGLDDPTAYEKLANDLGVECKIVSGMLDAYPEKNPTWTKLWLVRTRPASPFMAEAETL